MNTIANLGLAFLSLNNPDNFSQNSEPEQYVPGTCNIGKEEIKRRKIAGWFGLILTAITIAFLLKFDAPHWLRLIVFIPATMGATGFIQAYSKFCVYFGFGHMFNFGNVGKTDTIEQAAFRMKDRKRAWQIMSYALVTGLLITSIFYFFPA